MAQGTEELVHCHWQDLLERPANADGSRPKPRGFTRHGRAWLRIGRLEWHVEWSLGELEFAFKIEHDDEGWLVHVALPLVSLFVGFDAPWLPCRYPDKPRALELSVRDWTIRWCFWSTSMEWHSKTPRWRDGSFNLVDFLLGRWNIVDRPLKYRWVLVPMPERAYVGCACLSEVTVKRPRWFGRCTPRVTIIMLPGEQVPFPGKGESSWDCGEDGYYESTSPARSISDGVAELVRSVLGRRERYGGSDWMPERRKTVEEDDE